MACSLLIIDDDVKLGTMLRGFLDRYQMPLEIRPNGEMGLKAAVDKPFDLILLDVMLPDLNGFEVLKRIRAFSDVSVLLLTARGEPADRIHGLQLGADDYLPKPFDPDELVARIRAVLRRRKPATESAAHRSAESNLVVGELAVDLKARIAKYRGSSIDLSDIEFSLLRAFLQAPGEVLNREELMVQIFERPFHPLNRTLDMLVSRLRKKLYMATHINSLIKTIRSAGYLFSTNELQDHGMTIQ